MRRALVVLALVSAFTHALAGVGSLLLLQGGSPVGPDAAARAAYIDAHTTAWRLGWLCWTIASISLVLTLSVLGPGEGLGRAGLILAVVALAIDLASQTTLAFALPAAQPAARSAIEALGYAGTGVVANSLYTIAVAFCVIAARLPRALAWGVAPAIAAGVAVTIASYTMHPGALLVATGTLTVLMTLWLAALGVWAWRASS